MCLDVVHQTIVLRGSMLVQSKYWRFQSASFELYKFKYFFLFINSVKGIMEFIF